MNTQTNNSRFLPILNIVAFVTVLFINFLSNALPINGRTAGEISDALPSFFTPAGYTFSIWGLIYLALAGFIVYQVLPAQRNAAFQQRIGWLFIVSSIANTGWLFAWHYGFYAVSVVFMLALLVTLITIYMRLRIGRPHAAETWQKKLFVHVPFSLYMGWITVATIANIASVSAYLGWDGFGISGPVWAVIMMAVAAVVVGLLFLQRSDPAYSGVLIWALFGIRAAQADTPLVANSALIIAGIIAVLTVIAWVRTVRQPQRSSAAQIQTA